MFQCGPQDISLPKISDPLPPLQTRRHGTSFWRLALLSRSRFSGDAIFHVHLCRCGGTAPASDG